MVKLYVAQPPLDFLKGLDFEAVVSKTVLTQGHFPRLFWSFQLHQKIFITE